ncbi:hypothetical protein BOTBODRAFT_145699 [Botryobasidium botryosum FD-172 SS1]|uniref:Uncharacterized protein n=1 Tax=Botryobasidium botryosum (strain FD-172 SS1) TaxID=930990 RepID=A0A067MRX0_BOTB1|nr:hypothetical protein BOTBODRAFT_145699 [Botryobasidium botryosum FD-172 SS1]
MKFFAIALAFAAAAVAQNSSFTVNTPASIITCEPTAISWTGGTPPYFVSIIPGGQPAAPALKSFPQQSVNTLTWLVDLAAQAISIQVKDATGLMAYSATTNIMSGSNTTCITTSTSGTPVAGAPGTTAGAAPTPSNTPSAGSANAPVAASTSAHASSSGTAAPSPKPTNGAFSVGVSTIGFAGFAGLIGAALL